MSPPNEVDSVASNGNDEKTIQAALHGEEVYHDLDEAALALSPDEEARLLRRIDISIVPYVSLLYLLSFLDRVNIGQAKLAGLVTELHLTSNEYSIALTIFFVSYVAFELPSNLALKALKPHRWIALIMFLWSIAQITMGLVHNKQGLYATRWFLGMFEAGLFPGINYLMTTWYTRKEQSMRISIFFAGATLAGAFGGILAFGIRHMAGKGGKGGWAWIFILEGLLTFVCCIPAYWLVQDFPHESKLLSDQERAKWLHRLTISQGVTNAPLPFSMKQVWRGVLDWKTYVYAMLYLSIATPFYSLSLFTPTIIAALGFTNAAANLLSAAPYALGFITTLLSAYFSDRFAKRGPFIVGWMLVVIAGYGILISDVSAAVKYFAIFLTVAGVSPCIALAITWIGNNSGPMYTRATVMGIFFSFGNSAGIISSWSYPASTSPRFVEGHAIAIAFAGLAVVLASFLIWYNRTENARRDRLYGVPAEDGSDCSPMRASDKNLLSRWGLEGRSRVEVISLGDRHPAFRQVLPFRPISVS
ncbi:putative MFS nicotinic acid transporter Tna1 [Sistotremastrum niveocremeum HHB9708]|uniref:MFS nicotinic acid transporter Tna1 n=2 Tax=Sistotremastraceae TaxID=3402574 RepID=A0A166EXU8_9AGAM|nr:putative MFS nicotinic acid transporter Tna1 [Sistotremastrum niveocremeum HHB9708]KZT40067.1 MFS nicotinic acid transporter Tna1 [Sistotremastrum suecicum HHB10207 ss-3]